MVALTNEFKFYHKDMPERIYDAKLEFKNSYTISWQGEGMFHEAYYADVEVAEFLNTGEWVLA